MPKRPKGLSNRVRAFVFWFRGIRTSTGRKVEWDDLIEDRAIQAADEDRLSHQPLAELVAEIAVSSSSPTTIGLFGPWGSGKSGLLRLVKNQVESFRVPVVVIDAWKYREKPLSRQFVTEAAAQLGEQTVGMWLLFPSGFRRWRGRRARRAAWSQLYESRRSRRIRFRSLPSFVVGLGVALATFFLVRVLGQWVVSELGLVSRPIPSESPDPFLSAAILTAVASFALAALTTESDLNTPDSEEEFERVLTEAVLRGSRGRVVFLVDELDRASPAEVLATLRTIRTFFDVPDAAFVVAADRDVIETALSQEPTHVSPRWPDSTYSGFAGSYLDKLFQVQLYLPPIRERRLTHMAVRLVHEKIEQSHDCVWASIGEVEEVVSVLLPSHVNSPRRVKVLLNAFATALRVALIRWERGAQEAVDVRGRHRQLALAKLVCLRTEFPLFARQLPTHPRLVEALSEYITIEEGPESQAVKNRRIEDLLRGYPRQLQDLVEQYGSRSLPVEEPLGVRASPEEDLTVEETESVAPEDSLVLLERRRADELLRYLSKTSGSPHPNRDLIYGTSLGDVFNLDAEVAASLEADSLDARLGEAMGSFDQLETNEQAGAVHLLAELVAKEVGIERRNAMRTLISIATRVDTDSDLSSASQRLADAFRNFRRMDPYEEEWTEALLALSRWLPDGDRAQLQTEVLEAPAWKTDDGRVEGVLETSEWWSADAIGEMRDAIPGLIEDYPDTVIRSLSSGSPQVVASLWSPAAWRSLGANDGETVPVREFAEALGSAERQIAWAGVGVLLDADLESMAHEVASALGGPRHSTEVREILVALAQGTVDPENWLNWADLLRVPVDGLDLKDEVARVSFALAQAIRSQQIHPNEGVTIIGSIRSIGLTPADDPSLLDKLTSGWWRSVESIGGQVALLGWTRDFMRVWPQMQGPVNGYRAKSIEEALFSGEVLPAEAQDLVVDELRDAGAFTNQEHRRRIRTGLSSLSAGHHELAYAHLWRTNREHGQPESFEVLQQVLSGDSSLHDEALALWIATDLPRPGELWDALLQAGPMRWRPPITDAIRTYLERTSRSSSTALVRRMLSHNANVLNLLASVDPRSINQIAIAREIAKGLEEATNSSERRRVLRRCEALGLTARGAQNELVKALDHKRQESTAAAADILRDFPASLVSAPGASTLVRSLDSQVKKAGRNDLVRKIAKIWDWKTG